MADAIVIQEAATPPATGYKFSWGLAIAGGVISVAVTFFLLLLGAGFGLLLVSATDGPTPSLPTFLTLGGIYFVAAQAFGFAVGGHVAGTLLGHVFETDRQESSRAAIHGLVAWAVAVLATVTMVAFGGLVTAHGGMTAGAIYGASAPDKEDAATGYVVDKLFRPEGAGANTARPALENGALREEAGRIVDRSLMMGAMLTADDKARLTTLTADQAGVPADAAAARVDTVQAEVTAKARLAADIARKTAAYSSLWIALALLFGAFVSMVAAVLARTQNDKQEMALMGRAALV